MLLKKINYTIFFYKASICRYCSSELIKKIDYNIKQLKKLKNNDQNNNKNNNITKQLKKLPNNTEKPVFLEHSYLKNSNPFLL
jgi:hypothetical protein